jgi:hypothetical protein
MSTTHTTSDNTRRPPPQTPQPPASLAEENALAATLKIAESYESLMLAHKKEVHCTIVTAEVGVCV